MGRPSNCIRHTPRLRSATARDRLVLSGAGLRRHPWTEVCLIRISEAVTAGTTPWPLCMLDGEGCRCQPVLGTETEGQPGLGMGRSNERDPSER